MARSSSGESVLERIVRILEAFDLETRALTVSQIAHRSRLPLSTASRLIENLVQRGLLARDTERRLRIGVRLWELAQHASPRLDLREAGLPRSWRTSMRSWVSTSSSGSSRVTRCCSWSG